MPVCFSVSSVSIFMQMEKLRSVVPNLYVCVFVIISSNIKLSEPANVATSFMCLSFFQAETIGMFRTEKNMAGL